MHRLVVALLAVAAGSSLVVAPTPARPDPGSRAVETLPAVVPEPAARALAAIGWKPEDLHFDREDRDLFGGGPWRLPLFDAWIDRPFVIPRDVDVFQKTLFATRKASDWSVFAGLRLSRGVRRGLLSDPVQALADSLPKHHPLHRALEEVWRAAARRDSVEPGVRSARGRQSPAAMADLAAAEAALDGLPPSWQEPLALILSAEAEAVRWRAMALASCSLTPQELYRESIRYVVDLDSDAGDPAFQRRVEESACAIDLPLLQAAATDLLLCLEQAVPRLEKSIESGEVGLPPPRTAAGGREPGPARSGSGNPADLPLVVSTPLGRIRIGSEGNDLVPQDDYLLLFDPSGDDRYRGGGASSPASPVSVLCDLSGQDRYVVSDSTRPAFGAGVTGIGILMDRSGDDQYRGAHLSCGAGLCGFGLLWDAAGNDLYDAVTASQGAALFGFGILADEEGDDRYHAFQQAQGYGYTLGCGILLDGAGNDAYTADDVEIRYPSAQSREHNSSLAQGFGFGKRADFSDGHSLAGGIGLLADGGGDDIYRCGVFGQGAGYWYGTGILADAGGNDRYEGIWYAQGAAAHFALGILWDGAGDDEYRATMNMAQGAGHDFSLGMLYDRSGSDCHRAPNLSLGGGNANGFGIFWDVDGDDRYDVDAAVTLGRSNVASRGGLRDRMKNLGLFLDTGGHDQYPGAKPFAGNGRLWTQSGTDEEAPLATEAGVGLDTE